MARSNFSDGENIESIRNHHPILHAANRLVIVAAHAAILGLLISAVVEAFAIGLNPGFRGLAAAALPPIVLAYSSFVARSGQSSGRRFDLNLFLPGLGWILTLLILVNSFLRLNPGIPLGEFIISLTLSALLHFSPRLSVRSRLSCSYGILAGFFLYLLIFGMPSG